MRKTILSCLLIATGSAFCWWPAIIEPGIHTSIWLPFALTGLILFLAAAVSDLRPLHLVLLSVAATALGIGAGSMILPFTDVIGHTYWPFVALVIVLISLPVAIFAAWAGRRLRQAFSHHHVGWATWLALAACVAFGPIALALTPAVVAARTARNDRVASQRVAALQTAIRSTRAKAGDPRQFCDGQTLKQHYSGPAFTNRDWGSITHNYVTADGYAFMVYCPERGGYRINAFPDRIGEGTRQFCEDEGGRAGCVKNDNPWP